MAHIVDLAGAASSPFDVTVTARVGDLVVISLPRCAAGPSWLLDAAWPDGIDRVADPAIAASDADHFRFRVRQPVRGTLQFHRTPRHFALDPAGGVVRIIASPA
jgi:hypothetical protein